MAKCYLMIQVEYFYYQPIIRILCLAIGLLGVVCTVIFSIIRINRWGNSKGKKSRLFGDATTFQRHPEKMRIANKTVMFSYGVATALFGSILFVLFFVKGYYFLRGQALFLIGTTVSIWILIRFSLKNYLIGVFSFPTLGSAFFLLHFLREIRLETLSETCFFAFCPDTGMLWENCCQSIESLTVGQPFIWVTAWVLFGAGLIVALILLVFWIVAKKVDNIE